MKANARMSHGVSVLVLAGLAIASAASATSAQEKVLRWAYQSDIQDLDPYGTTSAGSSMLINVYEALIKRNAKMELEPALATSWELVEPTRWRFHLRQGVKFHNGNDFNADDVIFSYERVSDKSSWIRDRVAMVDRIEKINDHTLDFITKHPNPIVPNIWTGWMIMDKEWSEENGATFPTNLVEGKVSYAATHENGTGPFRVTYRENGVRTEFEPFEDWWDKKQHNLSKVVFTPITQDGTRVAALLSGEIDMMYPVPVQDIKRVQSTGNIAVLSQPELRTIYFGFDQFRDKALETDTDTNPFKDVRVRKAIYQAIDVEGIKTRIMDGMSEPARTLISPILFPMAYEIERYPFDPEASKKLLAEAGYPNGFSTKIDCYLGRYVNDDLICQAMVTMLARVGIKAKLYLNPPTAMGKVIGRPNQTIAIYQLGWTPAGLDSYNVLYNLMSTWNPDTGAGRINNGDFSNKRIDEITALVESETDKQKRDALILEAYNIVHDNVYYVPLHHQNVTWAARNGVAIEQRPDDQFDFRNVHID